MAKMVTDEEIKDRCIEHRASLVSSIAMLQETGGIAEIARALRALQLFDIDTWDKYRPIDPAPLGSQAMHDELHKLLREE